MTSSWTADRRRKLDPPVAGGLDTARIKRIYARYAPCYDLLFGPPLSEGRVRAAEAANRLPGRRLLDLGTGTGLTLPHYRAGLEVVGLDLSRAMLRRARARIAQADPGAGPEAAPGARCVLVQADAEQLPFAAQSFDIVVAAHTLSATPDPGRLIAEMRRVCARGGHLIVLNHLSRNGRAGGRLDALSTRWARRFGWHPLIGTDSFAGYDDLALIAQERAGWARVSTLLVYRRG
jgi:phosphatidylethanolamine/phosphatidyl-N-methylethanolamine N-methyltransferase